MSMRYQAGVLTASYFPLKVPDAPTIGTATPASATSVSVTFTAPSNVGGGSITSYLVISSGGQTTSGSTSPITVTGLTTGVSYAFRVFATNAFGTSSASAESNSVTLVPAGQQAYTAAGTYSWVAPTGINSVSVVTVGAGGSGGGGGGELRYKNNITVVPANSYTVVVGAATSGGGLYAGSSTFNTNTVIANGGQNLISGSQGGVGGSGGTGDGGGNGGSVIGSSAQTYLAGGGAGGYSGAGGNGYGDSTNRAGAGGGGGGGYSGTVGDYQYGGGGGGVGLLGQGANGAAGNSGTLAAGGGSGGTGGTVGSGVGGVHGGGGGFYFAGSGNTSGGVGAVRIIWGANRAFPSTNTGDL